MEGLTVKKACMKAYDDLPEVFGAMEFCRKVRFLTGRPHLMDSTIMRKMREMREQSLEYSYLCIDNHKAIYQKKKY
jgi:hypothetical protein